MHDSNYNSFDQSVVLNDIEGTNVSVFASNPNEKYRHLYKTFLILIGKQASLKQKVSEGNDAPFENKELSKAIYIRSSLRDIFFRKPLHLRASLLKKKIKKKNFLYSEK